MSQFHFNVSRSKPTRQVAAKLERIAKHNGCSFIEIQDPGQGYLSWFAGPNYGHPFDQRLAADVSADIQAAGIER